MLKFLFKNGNVSYYEGIIEGIECFISVWSYGSEKLVDVAMKSIQNKIIGEATFLNRLKTERKIKPLLFVTNYDVSLHNYNLYEYERLVEGKGKDDVKEILKSICICFDNKCNCFYFSLENYDEGSEITPENIDMVDDIIEEYIIKLEDAFTMGYSHTENYCF